MRTTLHDRHRCAQNVDHFAHSSRFSPVFAEVVCTLGTTPSHVGASPSPNGGICTTWGSDTPTTRPLTASCSAKSPPRPAWRAPEGPHGPGPAGAEGTGEIGRPGGGARRTLCPWPARSGRTTSRSADRSSRRGRLAVRTAEAGGADATASQISHVIYRGHFSRYPKNVAIPTTQIQYLNQSSRNYVRNCWLTAIAGHQGNAPSRRAEPLIEARGADGSRAAHGAARPHSRARIPENPRVHKQQPAPHSNT